jgi:quinoprotein glucose dehydrogenase
MPYGRGDGRLAFRMPSAIRSDSNRSNAPESDSPTPAATAAAPPRGGLVVQGLPMLKPPYGTISAIDVGQGRMLWTVPNGETPANITNHPALKGLTIPRTGRVGETATLTTKTLVIVAEPGAGPTPNGQRGSMLRAYDKLTGREVGAVQLPAPVIGSPMTYSLDGEQYLAMTIGGGGLNGELYVLKLPS